LLSSSGEKRKGKSKKKCLTRIGYFLEYENMTCM